MIQLFYKTYTSLQNLKKYDKIRPIELIIVMCKVGFSFKFHFHFYLEASFGSVVTSGSYF